MGSSIPGCLLGLPAPVVHGADATDGLCDSQGRVSAASGIAPCPCDACLVCPSVPAVEQGPATAGSVQGTPCCLAAVAVWEGVVAVNGPQCLLGDATGCKEGRGWVMGWGCGLVQKEDWRVMGAERQLGKGAGAGRVVHPEGTTGVGKHPEDIS